MVVIIILCICVQVFFVFMMGKNVNTLNNTKKIMNAICKYRIEYVLHKIEPIVAYKDMESYEATLFRIWDWGYKRILPKDKFEIIEPYIGRDK